MKEPGNEILKCQKDDKKFEKLQQLRERASCWEQSVVIITIHGQKRLAM